MTTLATPLESFSSVLTRAWHWTRRAFAIALAVAGVVVVVEAWRILDTLASIHPWLAWGAAVLVGVPLLLWAARSAWRYARLPRVTTPPDLPPVEAGWSARDQERYRRYAVRWLRHQQDNPHLPRTERDRIPEAIEDLMRPLTPEEAPDTVAAARALDARGDRWVRAVTGPLDRQAEREIRVAAVQVAAATAISPSVLMDSLITLARNLDLIARIADLYYGRPGLAGTLRVARDVLGTAVAAGAMEAITDHVTGAISEMTGSFASRWIGPLGQGAVNGVLTIRMGNAAKRRCRSFTTPRPRWSVPTIGDVRREWSRLFGWIRADLGPAFAGPFARFADAPDDDAEPRTEETPGEPREGRRSRLFGRWFRRREAEPPTWVDTDTPDDAPDDVPGDAPDGVPEGPERDD